MYFLTNYKKVINSLSEIPVLLTSSLLTNIKVYGIISSMKIAIIGNAGSGKSTLGVSLQKIQKIPLYHLDHYFWKPGWKRPSPTEFDTIHNQLCDMDQDWIIEGMAFRLVEYRIQKADIIIFLDIPTYICLYRVFKRTITYWKKIYFASAQGCPEKFPDLEFLKYIWYFNRIRKPHIQNLLQLHKDQKKIIVITNDTQLKNFIANFESLSR